MQTWCSPGLFGFESVDGRQVVKSRHSLRVTGSRQRAGDDDPVIAGEHPGEALAVTLRHQLPQPPHLWAAHCRQHDCAGALDLLRRTSVFAYYLCGWLCDLCGRRYVIPGFVLLASILLVI